MSGPKVGRAIITTAIIGSMNLAAIDAMRPGPTLPKMLPPRAASAAEPQMRMLRME